MASVFYYLFFLLFTILCFIPFAWRGGKKSTGERPM